LTIALLDLDHFHGVNANFGWPTGDRVLRQFANIATSHIRQVDWLACYGGEEFCLVMTETDLQLGCEVAERIRRQVESCRISSIDGRTVSFTVSIGVARLTANVDGVVNLVELASNGLQEAKRAGRNRVVSVGEDGKPQVA
jgi:two-component system cell cycle response regulator